MKFKYVCLTLLLGCTLAGQARAAQEISVAAASDLQFALTDVAARYEATSGNHVNLSFGSSGNFVTQIQNGAPFDVFFSADTEYAKKLEAAGLAVPGSFYKYAVGRLALWVPNDSPLDLKQGLQVLVDPRVKKISIANPEHAPYGRAAVAAMKSAGDYDRVFGKLVKGENISQAATFVASGNAEVGLIALSLALAPAMKDKGKYVEVPAADYPAIEQAAVVLKSSAKQDVARQFLDYIKRPEIVDVLRSYGFSIPGTPAAPLSTKEGKQQR